MNETSITPINSVQPSESSTLQRTAMPAKTSAPRESAPGTTNETAQQMQLDRIGNLSNVSIRFQVNDQTQELIVLVIDRKSKRVLRSIPASELHKLQAGELLKMTA